MPGSRPQAGDRDHRRLREAERALVDASRELVRRFERKIETAVGGVWGG